MELSQGQVQNHVRRLAQQCRKGIKGKVFEYKKRARCNWPELHLYCGVCDLKTGLYIRSVVSMLINLTTLIINATMLYFLLNIGTSLYTMDIADMEKYLDVNFTEISLDRIQNIYKLVVTYMVVWITFKMVYILTVVLTIYAIYKKKPKILKFVLFVHVLNWIFDIFISIFGVTLSQIFPQALIIICVLFEGYNLMAISSICKQLKGKSKLLLNKEHASTDNTISATTSTMVDGSPYIEVYNYSIENQQHCPTCSCNMELFSTEAGSNNLAESRSRTNQFLPLTRDEEKSPNIKDVDIIFNQNQLIPESNVVLENESNSVNLAPENIQSFLRPNSLELVPNKGKEVDPLDIPTIYDENQLHVSGSPVIEAKQDNQTQFQ